MSFWACLSVGWNYESVKTARSEPRSLTSFVQRRDGKNQLSWVRHAVTWSKWLTSPAPSRNLQWSIARSFGLPTVAPPTTIVTTNFDLLLEAAAERLGVAAETYALGGIPRPSIRSEFSGVLHIHGALSPSPDRFSDLVLSDQDFGEFYLRRRVVPDFIYDAARLFSLVLVGYSANDPPMRYLLNAVAADEARFDDLKDRFIFIGSGEADPVELEGWRARGIEPIHYPAPCEDHSVLGDMLTRWAEFSAINGKRQVVEREVRRIVKTDRATATEADRGLFDHLFRRSSASDRERLAEFASAAGAESGWLEAMMAIGRERDQRQGR